MLESSTTGGNTSSSSVGCTSRGGTTAQQSRSYRHHSAKVSSAPAAPLRQTAAQSYTKLPMGPCYVSVNPIRGLALLLLLQAAISAQSDSVLVGNKSTVSDAVVDTHVLA